MKKIFTILSIILVAGLITACGVSSPEPTPESVPYRSATNPQIINGDCQPNLEYGKCIPVMGEVYNIGYMELFVLETSEGYDVAIYEQGRDDYVTNSLPFGHFFGIAYFGTIQWETDGIFIVIDTTE